MGEASSKIAAEVETWPSACLEASKANKADGLQKVRQEAIDSWSVLDLPSSAHESWKYTNIDPIFKRKIDLPVPALGIQLKSSDLDGKLFDEIEGAKLVFVDGRFDSVLSVIDRIPLGMTVRRISATQDQDEVSAKLAGLVGSTKSHTTSSFAALNLALTSDVVTVRVEKGARVNAPLRVIHVTTSASDGRVLSPRIMIDAEEDSCASMIEVFSGLANTAYIMNAACEVFVHANAVFNVHRVQDESIKATHLSHTAIHKEMGASGNLHLYSFGGALVRNDVEVVFKGERGSGTVNGLTVLSGDQHVDNATVIEHAVPNCESSELFKGIYSEKSRGVFGGTIIVRPDAQKTNAYQSNQTLLLSDQAGIDTRPQLKIWADDVKCTHGATIGQLDQKALMYLRARGLDAATAKQFLIHAFAGELTTEIPWEPLRTYIERRISEKLGEEPVR